MIRGIIFDLDGTLLNTITDLNNSVNETYKFYNYPKQNSEAETMALVGHGLKNLIKTCFIDRDEEFINSAYQTFVNIYGQKYAEYTKPYKGVKELVAELNKRNILLGVNSNKNQEYTLHLIAKNFKSINQAFVYGVRPNDKIKPDPSNVYECLEKMGVNKEEVLYVGDSQTDVKTAYNAGLRFVGVSWGFRTRQQLLEAGAVDIIDGPEELLQYLG